MIALHTQETGYDKAAIMHRAWEGAKKQCNGRPVSRALFANWLRVAWSEAHAERAFAASEARKALAPRACEMRLLILENKTRWTAADHIAARRLRNEVIAA